MLGGVHPLHPYQIRHWREYKKTQKIDFRGLQKIWTKVGHGQGRTRDDPGGGGRNAVGGEGVAPKGEGG